MRRIIPTTAARSRSVMVAVVLGTAFTAGGKAEEQRRREEERKTEAVSTCLFASGPAVAPEAVRDITRYCQVCWRNARLPADRWDDCTQQVFARLLERVEPAKWGTLLKEDADERREFVRAIRDVPSRRALTRAANGA